MLAGGPTLAHSLLTGTTNPATKRNTQMAIKKTWYDVNGTGRGKLRHIAVDALISALRALHEVSL